MRCWVSSLPETQHCLFGFPLGFQSICPSAWLSWDVPPSELLVECFFLHYPLFPIICPSDSSSLAWGTNSESSPTLHNIVELAIHRCSPFSPFCVAHEPFP